MKRKILLLAGVLFCILAMSFVLNRMLFIVLVCLCGLGGLLVCVLLILNKLYKKTNHWNNKFLFKNNFISNVGYRDNLSRNFDIVNLGSNPALFGFFYENVRGQNWATGSQGLPMDFEILKYYHSYLKEGGVVLIPIMPFTSISQYIKEKPEYWSIDYYMKFASILPYVQMQKKSSVKTIYRMMRFPLIYHLRYISYLFVDVEKDNRLLINEQPMSALALEQDAQIWINGWVKEFDVKSMAGFFDSKFVPYKDEGVSILKEMIDFCLIRDLTPVLITMPMTSYLYAKFSVDFFQQMIDDFIAEVNVRNIRVLNYLHDESLMNASLYMNSFFFNLRGRKQFTHRVLSDLGFVY